MKLLYITKNISKYASRKKHELGWMLVMVTGTQLGDTLSLDGSLCWVFLGGLPSSRPQDHGEVGGEVNSVLL